MAPTNGEYTMDKVARTQGEDNVGDIPLICGFEDKPMVPKKFLRGDFEVMPDAVITGILSFVPKDQTAFDALFSEPPSKKEVKRALYVMRFSTGVSGNVVMLGECGCTKKVLKICEIGLNQQTFLRIRWLVAEGPQPAGTDFHRKKVIMQDIYYTLIELIKRRAQRYGLNARTLELTLSDIEVGLSYDCFNGINGWVD